MGSCWGAQNPGTLRVGLGHCTSHAWAWTCVHAQVHLGPAVFWVCLNSLRTCGTVQGGGHSGSLGSVSPGADAARGPGESAVGPGICRHQASVPQQVIPELGFGG